MVITRKTAYGPSLRPKTSRTLRRLAWAMGLHMSTTMEEIIKIMPYLISSKVICSACRDRSRCCDCYFNPNNKPALTRSKLTAHLQKYFKPGKKLTLNNKQKISINKITR